METTLIQNDALQLVTFFLAGQKYAVEILKVQEINTMHEITVIPNAPEYIEGAVNLRGKVIPVVNLRNKFGIRDDIDKQKAKIVIIDSGGIVTGVIVDAVSDVLRISRNLVEPAPEMACSGGTKPIAGIAKLDDGLVMLLDVDRLLDSHLRHAERIPSEAVTPKVMSVVAEESGIN